MPEVARIGLAHGGWLYLEAADDPDGPIKAGFADSVADIPGTLRSALDSVTQAAREILAGLESAGPDELTVEFGVNLTVAAGALITKGTAGGHLKVTLTWSARDVEPAHD